MKKLALLLVCAGLLAGCASDTNELESNICGRGHYESYLNGCSCDPGWTQNEDGVCLVEVGKDGGNQNGEGNNGGNPGQQADNKCYASFYYTDPATHKDSGGEADFDMYLIGDFNGWAEKDQNYKMTYLGDGTHGIKLEVKQGNQFVYKYFIDGWAENSYHNDQTNQSMDNEGNNVAQFSSCGMSFGNANGKTVTEVSNGGGNNGGGNNGGTNPGNDGCKATFIYENKWTSVNGDGSPAHFDVYLIGSFNMDENGQWKLTDPAYKMTPDGRGRHTFTMDVKDWGPYTYKFYVDGWEADSYKSDPNACVGDMCDNQGDGTCGKTYQYIEVPADGNGGGDGGNGGNGGNSTVVPTDSNAQLQGVKVDGLNVTLTFKDTPSNVRGGASPQINGNSVTDTVPENSKYAYFVTVGGQEVYVPVWVESTQFDWHDALLYFAFTDRFKDGDPSNNEPVTDASHDGSCDARWMGGDFKGLRDMVEDGYFDKLGVNTLWISSVSMNTQGVSWGSGKDAHHSYSAYHSYWPISAFMTDYNVGDFNGVKAIEPHFGTDADLKALVDSCHKRGIRVLVDFAANHVFKDSPMVAKHRDWFNDIDNPQLCDNNDNWNKYSEKCWFSQDLPDINYENGDARKTMVDHATWLIKQTNIDGFRVDAVKHMNIQFIKDLRAAVDKLFANTGIMFYMVGETFDGAPLINKYIGNDLLHAQFDFPLYNQIRNHILGMGNYAEVANSHENYNSDLMGTFIGNHDVSRAVSHAAGNSGDKWNKNPEVPNDNWQAYLKVKTAFTVIILNSGVPLIYYGDEYGMEGANDPDNRRMMEFGDALNEQQKGTLDYVRLLGQIRKNHKAITRGHRENLSSGGGYWCYKMTDGNESIIVGVSRADGGDNAGCSLNGTYKLQSLLDADSQEFTADGLDLSNNHLQVYLVK